MSRADWFSRRQHAENLASALRAILNEASDLEGIALKGGAFSAVLESSARDLRNAVADLIDALRDDLILAASGFDAGDVEAGCPATPERIAYLLSIHQTTS